jgi:hypothetical protein
MRWVVIVVACVLGGTAVADNATGAEAAFQRGRTLVKEGKYKEACAAFEQSYKLEPQLGTRYNLALCWEKLGRLASAWTALREVAQRDTNKARRDQAAAKATQLEPKLAKVRISAPAVPGLKITSNGDDATNLVDLDSPTDPGAYEIVATAPGHKPWSTRIDVNQPGKVIVVTVPPFDSAVGGRPTGTTPPVKPDGPAGTAVGPKTDARSEAGTPDSRSSSVEAVSDRPRTTGRATTGKLIAGAGAAVAATGLVFGVLARSKWNAVRDLCGDDLICDTGDDFERGKQLGDAATLRGNVSTGLVVVGAAGVAVGVVLWLTAPKPRERAALHVAPTSDGRSVGLVLGGAF